MKKTRILFFGTPEFAVRILNTLIEEGYDVIGAVSQPDRPVGRKHRIEPTPVHAVCIAHDLPCLQPEKLKEAEMQIRDMNPDLIITCAYGQFIPSSILNIPVKGCLNIHPSLLPKYRGGAPIQHAVMNGDTETGVCLMEMKPKMDSGDIYACYHTDIGADETFSQLNNRLMDISCQMVREQLPEYLKGNLQGIPQDEDRVVLGLNISKEEERLSFADEDIHQIYNHIRGLIDGPAAYGCLEGKRVKFYAASKEVTDVKEKAGTILGFDKTSMKIACTGGILHVYQLQMEGRKRMSVVDFRNGSQEETVGKVFE
ncbi:MAG: methionyl-tRNA formyltransferase [Bulleidia sp.]